MSIIEDSFYLASYLTDPICKAHESFRRLYVVDALNPTASKIANWSRKFFLMMAVVLFSILALFTTGPGAALRGIAAFWQKNPFTHVYTGAENKILPQNREFTLLSWNICCVAGGYTISDGGVVPWEERIDDIVRQIIEKDADVNCLYETFDTKSAYYLTEKLKEKGYGHFYYNIGPQAIGVSSGIMIASKYEIKDPEFTLFPKETLVGRTKNAAKGIFGFDLVSEGKAFARVFTTHLQHSEEPAFPTPPEIKGRKKQMEILVDKVNQIRDRAIVITGDMNQEDLPWPFQRNDLFEEKTWGGDAFCAKLEGKRVSGPLNLDHTMAVRVRNMATSMIGTGYDPNVYKREATSDHNGLFSRIAL